MFSILRKSIGVITLVVLGQGASPLEAGRLKQAAVAAAGLAVLVSGEPWMLKAPSPVPAPGFLDLGGHPGLWLNPAEGGQGCSRHCGREFQMGLIHCETLPMVLRNLCLTRIMADDESCMAKCLGEEDTAPFEDPR